MYHREPLRISLGRGRGTVTQAVSELCFFGDEREKNYNHGCKVRAVNAAAGETDYVGD